jgi:hypothetical protein
VNCAYLALKLSIDVDRAKLFVCFIPARDDCVSMVFCAILVLSRHASKLANDLNFLVFDIILNETIASTNVYVIPIFV